MYTEPFTGLATFSGPCGAARRVWKEIQARPELSARGGLGSFIIRPCRARCSCQIKNPGFGPGGRPRTAWPSISLALQFVVDYQRKTEKTAGVGSYWRIGPRLKRPKAETSARPFLHRCCGPPSLSGVRAHGKRRSTVAAVHRAARRGI